ncbi:MAG: hypothetical protein M3246_00555 [Actinomycetota bacterium]|nr:hypothetical protein [Actinomycetota bacterium]
MSPIATIYEKPKEARPYLSARHDRNDGPVLETLFLEVLDAAKAAISYARWHPAGDDLEDDSQVEPSDSRTRQLICQIEEAYKDLGVTPGALWLLEEARP